MFPAPGILRVFSAPGNRLGVFGAWYPSGVFGHPGASGTWSCLSLAALGGGFVHGLKAVLLVLGVMLPAMWCWAAAGYLELALSWWSEGGGKD